MHAWQSENTPDTWHKALAFNMDRHVYGTLAEIGAGQETVRWFFKVGGAAGSIAKSMSAYDMKFSDSIYGECRRYVSRERLQAMLDTEYHLLVKRLGRQRGQDTAFFAFANTVATFSYTQQRAGHGWLGIRFQHKPGASVSQIELHVSLKGRAASADQDALGILGVNLIYGARYLHENPQELLLSLMDDLSPEQLEIDNIDFSGPAFGRVDNRLMALQLVQNGFTEAALFGADGKLILPADALYKKAVLVERSRFRPPTHLTMEMLDHALKYFRTETGLDEKDIVVLSEMTLQNLSVENSIEATDFMQRVDILCALGKKVLVSNYAGFYRLAQYLFKLTRMPVAITLGIPTLEKIFQEDYYQHLDGGILEAFGKLFRNDMRLYVCPALDAHDRLTTIHNLRIARHLQHLYQHLLQNGFLRSLDEIDHRHLKIHADAVLEKIHRQDQSWREMVPETVAGLIDQRQLFSG